ncbi:MAG: TetR/AcrR family transcriptional regulator [Anaerolineae bacterium]|nr:TetR/AcrR family transcriptional regulator [Anaerolineae bacterium]
MRPLSAPQHTDRRKARTRRMLREALFALMLEKGYETITIEDITERADVGRTTFYLHYKDKEELLLESIESIALDLKEQIDRSVQTAPQNHASSPNQRIFPHLAITILLKHAALNARLYLPILRGEGTPRAPAHIRELIHQMSLEYFTRRSASPPGQTPPMPLDVLINFFSTSLLGMLTWWLENNLPFPPEQMAELYLQLFYHGAASLLAQTTPAAPQMPDQFML